MDCPRCSRPARRLKRGVCCACYERDRYRDGHFDPAVVAPCVLCGERGPVNRMGTPIRHDGEPWGLKGDICSRCASSIHSEASGNTGFRWRRLSGAGA